MQVIYVDHVQAIEQKVFAVYQDMYLHNFTL